VAPNQEKPHTAPLIGVFPFAVDHLMSYVQERHALRTLKYLEAVASGKLIVAHLWLDQCLSLGRITDPLIFEVSEVTHELFLIQAFFRTNIKKGGLVGTDGWLSW
jgi:hypothetical protein